LATYRYDAFGNLVTSTGTVVNSLLYRGERFDATLGWYNLRARPYVSEQGRFPAMDSFVGDPNAPQTLNKYAYTHNDPIDFMDPSGQFEMVGALAGISVITTLLGFLYHALGAPNPFTYILRAVVPAFLDVWVLDRLGTDPVSAVSFAASIG